MLRHLDNFVNRVTMYRLVLYYLAALLGVAVLLSFAGALPYDPYALLVSIGALLGVCSVTNWVFAKAFGVTPNAESSHITALILALIITPMQSPRDLWFLLWAGILAMASKYMLARHRKHLFNPAAVAVALTAVSVGQTASWWVGDARMLPFVLAGGVLVVRKIRRTDLVATFLAVGLATTTAFAVLGQASLTVAWGQALLYSPLVFFAFVILTEPLTTPPTRRRRITYGALAGLLVTPQLHLGSLYFTPELAILAANVFAYVVSPKTTLLLTLKQKIRLAPDIYDFVFLPSRPLAFAPGQYMEWTLGHRDPDSRGNRRYFTLASSPTEGTLRLGVKFHPQSSSFKEALLALEPDQEIVAAGLDGEFVLPADPDQKCVFLAGGIGVTPFRSMIQYMLDTGQRRPLVLFYAAKTPRDIVYRDVFDRAERELGLAAIYTVTDPPAQASKWQGRTGRITAQLIREQVPDYATCQFYLSGPPAMVDAFRDLLAELDVPSRRIKTDYFPGLP